MNWISDMNSALCYIEKNIEKNIERNIDSSEVAKAAHMSKFHFLRIFKILTGRTVGDYIRERRLSLSARDVVSSKLKIIDIAYKYGYETPEAFTKAFKRLHGISPSEARKNKKNLKAIPPLSFQITVKGEEKMNYRIEVKKSFKVAGITRHFNSKNGENFIEIPKFWNEICKNGKYDLLEKNQGKLGVMGICGNFNMETQDFDYSIVVEGDKLQGIDNYNLIEVPKLSFAIFECIGPMPDAMHKVYKRIFSEWFPATKYEHADGPELEVYFPGNCDADDYKSEIWIPVIEKGVK